MTARKKAEPEPVEAESKAQEKTDQKPNAGEDIGGLEALQASFDEIHAKGYIGPEKED
jgi:hypothetical protein